MVLAGRRVWRVRVAAALAVAALTLLPAAATAKPRAVKTAVTLTERTTGSPTGEARVELRGKVRAKGVSKRPRRSCRRNRVVRVRGAGKARTNAKGRFTVSLPRHSPAGSYRAKVARRKTRAGGRRVICRKARSKRTRVKVLARPAEPVVLTGRRVGALTGVSPDRIVGFAYGKRGWKQIPVQVDERHVVDLRTVHNFTIPHSLRALEYSDPKTLTGPDPEPRFDANDEIALMARDLGERAPATVRDPRGVRRGSGVQVRVTDPLDRDAARWVYLFQRSGGLDPGAGRDYVSYDFELLAGEYPGDYRFQGGFGGVIGDPPANPAPPANPEDSRVRTAFYSERFGDRWITDELRITAGRATGVDILDRNRLGTPFVTDRPQPCPRTENTFAAGHGAFVANIDGPVRAIRDYIGANSGLYTQRRQVFYQRRQDLTTFLRVHPLPIGPSDLLDLTREATGMTYQRDGMSRPVIIDGVPDNVPTGALTWELVQGPQGSLAVSHRLETDIPGFEITSIYLDDATPSQLPCTGDTEALGTTGTSLQNGLPRTDPTPRGDSQNQGLPVYNLTSDRTHFYDAPGMTARTAKRRSDEAHEPLTTRVSPRRGP